ncbi:UdgX family uracil-DNA binding protein [Aquabacter sp. CN5-332]|uniref:UdgX family uracil-DNA binding protein n=1 Tax=Aquabacter sp. CN5-332 TaxID=3156608 RepID=UPI0032B5CF10
MAKAARFSQQLSGPLRAVAAEAAGCERCPLYRDATQTVFGEGPSDARIMLVGEQPGDKEDLEGRPFVGPAGRLLDQALAEAGLDRQQAYVTNAVKHFKHQPRGKRRIHKRPDRGEIQACHWWLDQELALVRPSLVIALGATAAQALAGRKVVLSRERGLEVEYPGGLRGMSTVHPSSILRVPDAEARHAAFSALVEDLRTAVRPAQEAPRVTPIPMTAASPRGAARTKAKRGTKAA